MPLCNKCDHLELQTFPTLPDECLSLPATQVEAGATKGCEFCAFILAETEAPLRKLRSEQTSLPWSGKLWIRLQLVEGVESAVQKRPGCCGLRVSISKYKMNTEAGEINSAVSGNHDLCVVASPESRACQSGAVSGRYLGQDRSSPDYIAAVKAWLDECIDTHGLRCSSTLSGARISPYEAPLPTRCIDVAHRKGIRLQETSGMRGAYITLSHRWTSAADRCKTTKENYQVRDRGAGFHELSQNFRDTILIAQRLGVQYVWIDSLCIIQGDAQDLGKELVRMAEYYQHSLFTIAAEGPSNDHDSGFLRLPPERPFDRLVKLSHRESGKRKGHFYVYKRRWRTDLRYRHEVDQSELLSRGWVCQEWFLSRRIVHFAPTETYLECLSSHPRSICNDVIRKTPCQVDMGIHSETHSIASRLGFKTEFELLSGEREDVLGCWYDLIQAYSQLGLTKSEDHLNAVAGIAAEFAATMQTTASDQDKGRSNALQTSPQADYASGIWLTDIHFGLLWHSVDTEPRACPCGAPSWSWLSVAGAVTWPQKGESWSADERFVRELEVVSVLREEQHDANAHLITMSKALQVKAKLLPVLIRGVLPFDIDRDLRILTDCSRDHMEEKTTRSESRLRRLVCPVASPQTAGGWGIFERPDLLAARDGQDGSLTLALRIATRKKVSHRYQYGPSKFKVGHGVADVLFIEPVEEGEGRFRRIGVGSIFERDILHQFEEVEDLEIILV